VSHCGESTFDFYLVTLMLAGVAVGWIDLEPIWGKGQHRVRTGVHQARRRLPLPLREWHTDNGVHRSRPLDAGTRRS
jgi:hypothetical protein